jgi:hypothetical protein
VTQSAVSPWQAVDFIVDPQVLSGGWIEVARQG